MAVTRERRPSTAATSEVPFVPGFAVGGVITPEQYAARRDAVTALELQRLQASPEFKQRKHSKTHFKATPLQEGLAFGAVAALLTLALAGFLVSFRSYSPPNAPSIKDLAAGNTSAVPVPPASGVGSAVPLTEESQTAKALSNATTRIEELQYELQASKESLSHGAQHIDRLQTSLKESTAQAARELLAQHSMEVSAGQLRADSAVEEATVPLHAAIAELQAAIAKQEASSARALDALNREAAMAAATEAATEEKWGHCSASPETEVLTGASLLYVNDAPMWALRHVWHGLSRARALAAALPPAAAISAGVLLPLLTIALLCLLARLRSEPSEEDLDTEPRSGASVQSDDMDEMKELAALDIRRQAVEAAVEAALVHADRQYELLEEQVEQLTAALGHTARQKADAEARIRIHEQEVDELSIMLQQAEDQKVQADCETTRAREAIVTVNQAATRLAAAQAACEASAVHGSELADARAAVWQSAAGRLLEVRDAADNLASAQEAAGGGAGGRPEQILEVRSMRQKIDALLNLALLEKQLEEAQARLNNRQSGTAAPLVDDSATGPISPGNQHPPQSSGSMERSPPPVRHSLSSCDSDGRVYVPASDANRVKGQVMTSSASVSFTEDSPASTPRASAISVADGGVPPTFISPGGRASAWLTGFSSPQGDGPAQPAPYTPGEGSALEPHLTRVLAQAPGSRDSVLSWLSGASMRMLSPGSASPSTQGGASRRQSQDSTPASMLGAQQRQNTPEHRAYDSRFPGDSVMQGLRVTLSVSPPRIPGLVATIQDAARASARAASAPSVSAASSPAIGLSLLSPVKEEPSEWRSSRRLKGKVSSPFLDQMPSGGGERGTRLRPIRSGAGVGDAVPRNLIPALSTFKSERGAESAPSAAMSPAGWSAVLEARRAYAPGTSAKPSAMPGSVMQNRTRTESAKKRPNVVSPSAASSPRVDVSALSETMETRWFAGSCSASEADSCPEVAAKPL